MEEIGTTPMRLHVPAIGSDDCCHQQWHDVLVTMRRVVDTEVVQEAHHIRQLLHDAMENDQQDQRCRCWRLDQKMQL